MLIFFFRRKGGKEKVAVYNSDDEDALSKENQPDPTSEEYFMDDIDVFHAKKDKVSKIIAPNHTFKE